MGATSSSVAAALPLAAAFAALPLAAASSSVAAALLLAAASSSVAAAARHLRRLVAGRLHPLLRGVEGAEGVGAVLVQDMGVPLGIRTEERWVAAGMEHGYSSGLGNRRV
jgi:hypothetical protein